MLRFILFFGGNFFLEPLRHLVVNPGATCRFNCVGRFNRTVIKIWLKPGNNAICN